MKKLALLIVFAFCLSLTNTTAFCQIKTEVKTEQVSKDTGVTPIDTMQMAVTSNTGTLSADPGTEGEVPSNWADNFIIFLESSFGIILLRSALRYWPSKWNIDIFIVVRKILEYAIKFLDIIYGGFVTNRKSDGGNH